MAEINSEEVDDMIATWGYSLVGYVTGGFPGMEAITKLRSSWKVSRKFHIHKSSWLVFRFDNEEDRQKILDGGPYMIYGRPPILKHMPPLFEFTTCTNTFVPIWVMLPGLPVGLWNAKFWPKSTQRMENLCVLMP